MKSRAELPPIQKVIEQLLDKLGFSDYRVSLESSTIPGHISYNITGSDSGLLIGRNGQNLQALSKLVREIIISKAATIDKHYELENYVLDVDGYQEKQIKDLLASVQAKIVELESSGDTQIALEPMPAFQRRVVHSFVQDKKNLSSHSEGFGSDRKVIITVNEN